MCALALALLLSAVGACGGSASETPFPAEPIAGPPKPGPAVRECGRDADCRAGRVCVQGECVRTR